MAKKTLNDHLVTYYERKQLSPQTLESLKATINVAGIGDSSMRNWPIRLLSSLRRILSSPGVLAYVSVLILLGYIAWAVTDGTRKDIVSFNLSKSIAREVAMNHRKQLNVEFIAKTIPDLGNQMDKLDFSLMRPGSLQKTYTIVGARYCSIQGRIAAQIRLSDLDGQVYTLYQTRLQDLFLDVQDVSIEFEGLHLAFWHENGVFLGLAGPDELLR
jgi:hypothetical protein